MIDQLTVEGQAKINLSLDILGKRSDGYHEVAMVMQSIGLSDTLELEKLPADGQVELELAGAAAGIEADDSNLAWRAAALLLREGQVHGGVRMRLTKRIPIAAGLAGGSTDAAAALRGVNELYGLGFDTEQLCGFGARLGMDIPFCLQGGTMLATGRGELLRRLPDMPRTYVVLGKPPIGISTAWAYQHYDAEGAERHPDNDRLEREIAAGDRKAIAGLLCNVLESVSIKKYGIISEYKQLMLQAGAMAAMMSGSGPTVFGLCESEEIAGRVAEKLQQETEAAVFVTSTTGPCC